MPVAINWEVTEQSLARSSASPESCGLEVVVDSGGESEGYCNYPDQHMRGEVNLDEGEHLRIIHKYLQQSTWFFELSHILKNGRYLGIGQTK